MGCRMVETVTGWLLLLTLLILGGVLSTLEIAWAQGWAKPD